MFETRTGQMVRKFEIPPTWGTYADDARFSPDGRTLALMARPMFMLVDPFGNKVLKQLNPEPSASSRKIAFSPDGAFVASWYNSRDLSDSVVSGPGRWDLATGALLPGKRVLADWPNGIAISADGKHLLVEYIVAVYRRPAGGKAPLGAKSVYNHWVEIWDLQTLSIVGYLLAPEGGPSVVTPYLIAKGLDEPGRFRIRILPNGKWLFFPFARKEYAVVGRLSTIQLLDGATHEPFLEIDDLKRHTILQPVLSPDHKIVAAIWKFNKSQAGTGYELHVWNVAKAVDRQRSLPRNRSEQQWDEMWTALGHESTEKAYSALCGLYLTPEASCDYIKKRLTGTALPKDRSDGPVTVTAELLRAIRIIDVLEQMNTRESAEILDAISSGQPGTWLGSEAEASLRRLRK
jgi:hypothetical protein